ncbi:hypothetical protein CA267_005850 [Alteromonas pelagimontana]|uniref:FAD-dependent urate hydroxylase HpyO/Asp monooxygenase CreE-like FAD/NAD(P)-binding domain-containing protein n=1 Tax=Alteromonas pelagimontana TaxID=1858656 RepID=A0A6M4MAY1_9ALTE|nr:FAD/NAD(P)-binding protein [Alteromonas pelagimontana]QJR80332.1 hypothetical protein CA267_005850 [Alteromonas pelagimontana]
MKAVSFQSLAIIGGGPSALYLLHYLLLGKSGFRRIDIFEKRSTLGRGMPYGNAGALKEHLANVSSSELPALPQSLVQWLFEQSDTMLASYSINKQCLTEETIVPRLLMGAYLEAQFSALVNKAKQAGIDIRVHYEATVIDVKIDAENRHCIILKEGDYAGFTAAAICTGHTWPRKQEQSVAGYFDSPYPPIKLRHQRNHAVALRGCSLTAIDAISTLAVANGEFYHAANGQLKYEKHPQCQQFEIVMHALGGLMPSIRYHLDSPLLNTDGLLTEVELEAHRQENSGFLSLDFLFEHNFKKQVANRDAASFKKIANKNIEGFVQQMLSSREAFDPFTLFKVEYLQAEMSMLHKVSIVWKECLAVFSYALNPLARYLSAEDTQRMNEHLQPLIAIAIANIPQHSCQRLLALHSAGALSMISVGTSSDVKVVDNNIYYRYKNRRDETVEQHYQTFIDCIGQSPQPLSAFPFPSMRKSGRVRPAKVAYQYSKNGARDKQLTPKEVEFDANASVYYRLIGGADISASYQLLDGKRATSAKTYIMAVPYISGLNPDFSGLDYCADVAQKIAKDLET